MSFSVGIVGLPNVGKSTLFKALTKKQVDIAAYPFTTIEPNIGVVQVLDERLNKIADIVKPEKITPTIIEFVDIAGLVKDAHKGEGLGNQFLSHIRNCDAILEVVRGFEDQNVEHIAGSVNPRRDIEVIKTELLMKDLETVKKALEKIGGQTKSNNKEAVKFFHLLKKIEEGLSLGKKILELGLDKEERAKLNEFQFLTLKPSVYVYNVKKEQPLLAENLPQNTLILDFKIEEEISDLPESDVKELGLVSQLDSLIIACYNILDLITFYTIAGGKESRAWTLKQGGKCPEAGGVVHSDFENKFIKAEVIPFQKLVEMGSWTKAKEKGAVRTEGKEYVVQDGDVIEFKI